MLNYIRQILFDSYRVNCTGNTFYLEEKNRQAACNKAKFEARNDYLIYKFDREIKRNNKKISYNFPYFNDGAANSMCDYIIFYQKSNGRLFSVICNMKSHHKGNNMDQIIAGRNFSQYIFDTTKRLYPEVFNNIKLEFVNVLFSASRLYSNRHSGNFKITNNHDVWNLLSNDMISETFVFEHKCR